MFFPPAQPVLRVVGVTKRFPGVLALDDVSLELYPGEIHSLLGENGSGKSTLAKVVAGIYVPDRGRIEVLGRSFRFLDPVKAVSYGIVYIPQSPSLIERLTVAENVLIALRTCGILSSVGRVREAIVAKAREMGVDIDPEAEVGKLSYTQKQIVELLKAALLNAKVLLLDEVTTYLPRSLREAFYGYLRLLRSEGRAILLITHRVLEAIEVADRITVMRTGRVVRTMERREFDADLVRRLMFGSPAGLNHVEYLPEEGAPARPAASGRPVILLDDVWAAGETGGHALRGVKVEVAPGEILGVVGIAGNGQRELAEVLVGLRSIERGRYYLDGVDVTNKGPGVIRASGVGFVPEAPLHYSLSGDLSLVENLALVERRGLVLSLKPLAARARELIERYGIVASPRTQAKVLSGGNVMRLTIARELEFARKALVALNPTRSLDERFALSFLKALRRSSRVSGLSVVYISESLDEALRVSDRVAVISGGRIVGVFSRETVERETLEKLMVM